MKKPLRFFGSQKAWLQKISLIALAATVSAPGHVSAAFLQDDSPQNLLSIEVESATSNTPRSGDSWSTPSVAIGGFSGTGDLRAEPDDGDVINEGYSETSPELSFDVQMVATGTHFVHYRAHAPNASSDSLHIGFDHQEGLDTEDYGILRTPGYTWSNGNRTIEVDSVGTHSLQIWMREDGIYIDKIVLSTDPNWEPTGFGPPESPGGDDLIPTLDPIGDQSVAEGANLSFTLTGSDDNGGVTFSASNLPNGAVLDTTTGIFDWTPAAGQARDHLVTFHAIDSANQTSSEVITISVSGSGVCFYKQDVSGDFLLSIEAEHFPSNTPLSNDAWEFVGNAPAGFSGPGLMQALPDNGNVRNTNYHNISPELSADAVFAATGIHYVWVRGRGVNGAGNSLHAGIDDTPFASSANVNLTAGTSLNWSDGSDNFPVDSLGVHSVEAWMREDGTIIDKMVITNNPNFVPTGTGPTESSCGPLGDAVPVLTSVGDRNGESGNALTFSVVATDDLSTPVYSMMPLPPGATFDPATGDFAWTPTAQDQGVYTATIRATDSANQIIEETITITITSDAPPVLAPIGPQSATEGVLLSFVVTATDSGSTPTLSASNRPQGSTFNPNTGLFSWTPTSSDTGTHDVTFTATDAGGQTDDEVVTITVSADQAPVIDPIGSQDVLEGALLEFTVSASDDGGDPDLSATNLPSGAVFTPATGLFSWLPGAGTAGTFDVTFRATDAANQFVEEEVTITVSATGSCSYQQASSGDFLLVIEAENFPGNISRLGDTWQVPGNPVPGFSGAAALQTLPDNRTSAISNYAATAPELSVTGSFATTGTHYVWVRGHGDRGGSDSLHIGIDGNEVPSSAGIGIPRTSGYEWSNGTHTLNVSGLGIHSLEAWMREDGTYFDKLVLTTNPNFVPTGVGPDESPCGTAGDTPPNLAPIGPKSVSENSVLDFTVTASDDNGSPTLSATGIPNGASFDTATGDFSWTPGTGDAGTYNVTFTATDSAGQSDDEVVIITVSTSTNAPPVLASIGPQSTSEDLLLEFTVTATDDNSTPTLSATGLPSGATFNPANGEFSWLPGSGSAGSYNVTFIATDGSNLIDDETVVITVAATGACTFQQESSGSFLLSIEAENFPINIARAGAQWQIPANPVTGFSGAAALQALPDNSSTFASGFAGVSPELIATANFQTTGLHYIWVRGHGGSGGSDSLHAGIDGVETTNSAAVIPRTNGYEWTNGPQTINVSGVGEHPVNVWMREDGTYFDKIVITNDANFVPTGNGPAESACDTPGDQAPVLDPIGAQSVVEAAQLTFTVTATDDNDTPTLTATGLPPGATFNTATGEFDWTPAVGDAGGYTVTFTATDGANQTDVENVNITVQSGGGGGVCSYQQAGGSQNLLTIEAENFPTNTPRSGDTWVVPSNPVSGFSGTSALQTLPDNRSIIRTGYATTSPELGVTANFQTTGTHYVFVRGHGLSGGSDSLHFGIDGVDVVTSRAISIPRSSGYEWSDGSHTIEVTSTGIHSLQIWMREDGVYADKVVLTTNPNFTPSGTGPAESNCSGGGGGTDSPPTLDPIGDQNVAEQSQLSFTVTASDDNGSPSLSATNLPSGASFAAGSGLFSWTPGSGDAGVYNVTFTATDSSNQTDNEVVEITVTNAGGGGNDQPPTLNPIGQQSVEESVALSFTVTATDDNGSPTLSASGVPSGASFNANTGLFQWTPGTGDAANSPYVVVFTATDSAVQMDSESVSIVVVAPSEAAFLQSSTNNNFVSVEAENFHDNISRAGDTWQVPNSPVSGFSGASALQALDDNGTTFTSNYANAAAQLSYNVEFVTTGRHYIFVRGVGVRAGSDSVHVGLDGIESSGGTNVGIPRTTPFSYQWSDGTEFVDVNSTGLHTLDAWVREDGTYIDKIVLTTNPNFTPTGLGPQQSARTSECQIFPSTQISSPADNDLQSSSTLTVETITCLEAGTHNGWGVKFELDGGLAGGGSEQIVTSAPYEATFTGVNQAEHSIDIVVVNDQSVEQSGADVTDSVSAVGVGDYYVAFGDSITFGFGDDIASDDTSIDGRNTGGGYTPNLNDALTSAKGYPHTVENEGVQGDTSIDGAAGINAVISRHPEANFYLLKFGMNDARPTETTPSGLGLSSGDAGYNGTFKDNMQQMIDAITAAGATVALAKVNIALGDSASGSQYNNPETGARTVNIIEFNLVIDELVSENSLAITPPDFFDFFLQNNPSEYFDNIHPNGDGYDSMADLWADEL